ncbi:hypothetical protein BUALT_Bualt05G0126400 [Buddleja alternifolia]|uniref:DUF4216 domain-containing protein n=1 Tax=Buddleja alternifolia TaxID=168488 RepID=A0AAV6XQN0_9LAMI|nr:hypothetical protein BUALT_Bualt05G0126400 [Buddleja alternifolia]
MAAESSTSALSSRSGGVGASMDSCIGCLTWKSEIRYKGILYNINTEESNIGLRNTEEFWKCRGNKKPKNIPFKQLSYLLLTPRLQRLYTSQATAEHMRWHKENPGEEGKLCHPRDGEAWKHFDHTHPSFAAESRNVRLALSADGFNPHNQGSRPYSCWPVIVTPYNLPPWMCMDRPYMFLTLLVPGPKSPGRSLDVYLQPLIDELKTLWDVGVETYDVSRKQNFQMKATLMWTISDFPAYGMLSGWSTHVLPLDHSYRYQKDNFTKGRIEIDEPPIRSTGDEVEAAVSLLPNIEHDLQNVCKRRNLNLKEVNEKYLKPKASYALTKDERQMVLKWIKDLRLPDGFLNTLKRKVKNKARVEGSIVEAYLIEETSTFCSHFFAPNVETRSKTIGRNDNINQVEHVNRLSVFNSNFRPFSPKGPFKILNQHEKDACAIYILLNSPEISEYVELYDAEKEVQLPDLIPHALGLIRDKELTTWFYNYVENPANPITNNDIKRLSRGFNSIVKCWNGHIVNGYRFHTIEYGKGKSTMNSGVSISGSYYNDSTIEYYGELLEILELSFLGPGDNTVVMFKCKWFDSGRLGTKIHPRYNIVDINSARSIAEDNPFVLASQCHQVYYTPYLWRKKASDRNWRAVFRVNARSTYEISHTSIPSEQTPLEEFYQETSSSNLAHVVLDNELDEIDILIDVHCEEEEVNPDDLHLHERELDQEIEFDDLEEELVESDEEELLEYSDSSSG